MCCSALQCFAVVSDLSALQYVAGCGAAWCHVLQRAAVWCSMLQCVAVCCSVLQCVQGVAMYCSALQCVAVRHAYLRATSLSLFKSVLA